MRRWLVLGVQVMGMVVWSLGGAGQAQTLVINELQPANDHTLRDENGDTSDWIELWNRGAELVDLTGCGLSDDWQDPFRWVFGSGTILFPGEFLVVFASGKDRQPTPVLPLNPNSVSGLRVWLRADRIDPSDPEQVRIAGQQIHLRRWMDVSGRLNHAEQPDDGLQPLWIPAGLARAASLQFDGADDLLRLAQPAGTNDFCLFAVCSTSQLHETDPESLSGVGGVSGQRWLFGPSHGGDLHAGAGLSIGTNGISVYEHGSGYMPALLTFQQPIGSALQVLSLHYSARQPGLDLQGLPVRTGLVSSRVGVRAPVEIGAGPYGAFGGRLFEVLMFDRALSLDERRGIAQDLAERYGIPIPLPRHTSFQLNAGGEEAVLTGADGIVLDRVTFGEVPRDVSFGRGGGDFARWFLFADPTPGAPNPMVGAVGTLLPPSLSHEGGFYSDPFELTLRCPDAGAEIHYTLDGAEPTAESPRYHGPIPIRSRIGTANDLSLIPTAPEWQPPAGEVFKGWAVRARAFRSDALPSSIVTRTYWVHPRETVRYSLPVVALTTDRRHFFHPDTGIYVPGTAPGNNYSQRGPEWERPVHIEFYETDKSLVFAQDGDVKIHGNTSQNVPIKGLDLDGTGGAGREPFRHRMFPERRRSEFEHVLLRPSGHDHGMAFMRDELMQELAAEFGAETQGARPCIVFLNGEYWGLHYLKEKEDAEFVSFYGAVPVDALDYLEGYAAAKAGDTLHYEAMLKWAVDNDPADTPAYEVIRGLMEVPNYIDYKICEIFNYRWDIGNHRLWRPRTAEGRWRWLQFDNDVGWGGTGAEQPGWSYNMLAADLTPDERLHGQNNEITTFLLRRLMRNQQFRQDFINRFADLLNTTLHPTNTLARVNSLAAQLAPEMAEHCQRWRTPPSVVAWQQGVAMLRDFAVRRPDACRGHLVEYFDLPGTVDLTVAVDPPGAGTLRLNSLELSFSDHRSWRGTYFRGNPVELLAQPHNGFRWAGWGGLVGVSTSQVRLLLQGDWSITAKFERMAAARATLEIEARGPSWLVLGLSADPNTGWLLEVSTDLSTWSPLKTVEVDATGAGTTTVTVDSLRTRLFRARQR